MIPASYSFRPHDWGSFFNGSDGTYFVAKEDILFVPMIGDLFLIRT